MGLTIYYELTCGDESEDLIRDRLTQLHDKAITLPFENVSELEFMDEVATEELKTEVKRVEFGGPAVSLCVASCQAQNDALQKHLGENRFQSVEPECFFRFTVYPGAGCETAAIGLSRFPEFIAASGRQWSTGLSRWHWHSFCKTQYASNPKHGGVDHFLKCHLSLVELFDFANELGFLRRVGDDSGYWDTRDKKQLQEKLNDMNRTVAAFTGALKDAIDDCDGRLQAPITSYPNFEHLEAEGNQTRKRDD
jgi:hypothetical protein